MYIITTIKTKPELVKFHIKYVVNNGHDQKKKKNHYELKNNVVYNYHAYNKFASTINQTR